MPDVEVVVAQPDVCFDADAAGAQGSEERRTAPVVVVRVAWDREDAAEEVEGVQDGRVRMTW